MQGFNNGGKSHPFEKFVRWVPFIGIGIAGMVFFNKIAPFFIKTFDNVTSLVGSFAAAAGSVFLLVLIFHFVSKQWDVLSKGYLSFCRAVTRAFIKIDPLGYLDSYIETMIGKRKNLQATKVKLEGKKINLERLIEKLTKSIDDNMKAASASKKKGQLSQTDLYAGIAAREEKSILLYKPIYERMVKNLNFLEKLDEHWGISITKLKHEVQTKRTEYEMIRDTFKGLNEAESFANMDSQEAKNFQDSLLLLEESVTAKIAAIEDFEKRSKPIMDNIELEKQMDSDEGLRLLELYESNNGSLFKEISSKTIDTDAQVISSTIKSTDFSKLLRK